MRSPTAEEIVAGWAGITEDGPGAQITHELSLLVCTDPVLATVVTRMVGGAKLVGLLDLDEEMLKAVLCGALVYGLHMGMYIGEKRERGV